MAKAEITLKDGTKMNIEGTPDEILEIKEKMEKSHDPKSSPKNRDHIKNFSIKSPVGPLGRINSLVQEDFFKEKRTIIDIKNKLEEKGIFYDSTSLSPTLLRLVKKGVIRRVKEEGQWRYVNS